MNGAALISNREREVWTKDERRLIDRVSRLFVQRGVQMKLVCGTKTCPYPLIHLERDDTHPGGRVLRCGHIDRVFSRVY